jgi:hypothetical protein
MKTYRIAALIACVGAWLANAPLFSPVAGERAGRTDASGWGDVVNIKDFGAQGNNVADDTAAIQAAIDYAYRNKRQGIFCPAGNYRTTTSLFLDAPGNLRGSAVPWSGDATYAAGSIVSFAGVPWVSRQDGNVGHPPSGRSLFWVQTTVKPHVFAFSLTFVGERGALGNHEGFGCQLRPQFNNAPALWIGTGQGMHVQGLQIIAAGDGQYRGNQNPLGVGIGVAGGNGVQVL